MNMVGSRARDKRMHVSQLNYTVRFSKESLELMITAEDDDSLKNKALGNRDGVIRWNARYEWLMSWNHAREINENIWKSVINSLSSNE